MHTAQAVRDRDDRQQRALHGLSDRPDDPTSPRDDYTGAPLKDHER